MQRFFVAAEDVRDGAVTFSEAQSHQLRAVLRQSTGARVIALDNSGEEMLVELEDLRARRVRGCIVERRAASGEPRTKVVLYQSLLKGDKFEWVLQKGTELGVCRFVPVLSSRCVVTTVSRSRMQRWGQVVREAAEQAGRGRLPPIDGLSSLEQSLVAAREQGGLSLLPWEQEAKHTLESALEGRLPSLVHLFIGPEGGFTKEEAETATNTGTRTVTLGPRILRAETAALAVLSALFYISGEMR